MLELRILIPIFKGKSREWANDATSSVYDHYLRSILSVAWLINDFLSAGVETPEGMRDFLLF